MARVILVLFVLILFYALSFIGRLPASVQKAFDQKFPGATKVNWMKENNQCSAMFELAGVYHSANFNSRGEWMETESPHEFGKLPENVQTAFNTTYRGDSIQSVEIVETSLGEIKYEITFEHEHELAETFYDVNGNEVND